MVVFERKVFWRRRQHIVAMKELRRMIICSRGDDTSSWEVV